MYRDLVEYDTRGHNYDTATGMKLWFGEPSVLLFLMHESSFIFSQIDSGHLASIRERVQHVTSHSQSRKRYDPIPQT